MVGDRRLHRGTRGASARRIGRIERGSFHNTGSRSCMRNVVPVRATMSSRASGSIDRRDEARLGFEPAIPNCGSAVPPLRDAARRRRTGGQAAGSSMAQRPITPEETAQVDELVARGRAALRAFEGATQERGRPPVPGRRVGGRERDHVHAAGPHGRRGERHRRPRSAGSASASRSWASCATCCASRASASSRTCPRRASSSTRSRSGSSPRSCPTTNPELTPPGVGIFAIKCRDAVIFSPHPRSRRTTRETVEIMRRALAREGAPEDLLQCLERAQHPGRPVPHDPG